MGGQLGFMFSLGDRVRSAAAVAAALPCDLRVGGLGDTRTAGDVARNLRAFTAVDCRGLTMIDGGRAYCGTGRHLDDLISMALRASNGDS